MLSSGHKFRTRRAGSKPTAPNSTKGVSQILDELFSCEWSDKQYSMYKSIHGILSKHKESLTKYRMTVKNVETILANIKLQKWFQTSNGDRIEQLITGMKVDRYEHQETPSKTIALIISFPKHNGFRFKIKFKRGKKRTQLMIYLENSTSTTKSYFAAYDSAKEDELVDELPQFKQVYHILPRNLSVLTKREIVKLVNELVIFYDRDQSVSKTQIGHNTEMSFTDLAESI